MWCQDWQKTLWLTEMNGSVQWLSMQTIWSFKPKENSLESIKLVNLKRQIWYLKIIITRLCHPFLSCHQPFFFTKNLLKWQHSINSRINNSAFEPLRPNLPVVYRTTHAYICTYMSYSQGNHWIFLHPRFWCWIKDEQIIPAALFTALISLLWTISQAWCL